MARHYCAQFVLRNFVADCPFLLDSSPLPLTRRPPPCRDNQTKNVKNPRKPPATVHPPPNNHGATPRHLKSPRKVTRQQRPDRRKGGSMPPTRRPPPGHLPPLTCPGAETTSCRAAMSAQLLTASHSSLRGNCHDCQPRPHPRDRPGLDRRRETCGSGHGDRNMGIGAAAGRQSSGDR